jgi:hypothetical protein
MRVHPRDLLLYQALVDAAIGPIEHRLDGRTRCWAGACRQLTLTILSPVHEPHEPRTHRLPCP